MPVPAVRTARGTDEAAQRNHSE
jgi:hypothetical protein